MKGEFKMKRSTGIILLTFFAVLVIMVLFPPYAVMKIEGNSTAKHDFVGYHPIWNPPTKIFAYEHLEKTSYVEDASTSTKIELSAYVVIFNKIRFIGNAILLIIGTSVLLLIFKRKQKR